MDPTAATILVVDDEEPNRDMLSRRLQRVGYTVLTAADGYAALGMIEVESIDLVLLDINMPGIDGLQLLDKLRETRSEAQLPVIMASALDDSSTIAGALSAGANDYVTKPLDFPVVLARVEAQLRNRPETPLAPEPTPAQIGPGVTLGGRYQLTSLLGEGGAGIVYRARHVELDFDVAVKLLHGSLAQDPDMLERFRREGITTCRVQHPNAVSIYDFQTTSSGVAYLVMEFLRGRSLAAYLQQRPALSPERCAEILLPVCDVLALAHDSHVVHRDIKPENLFLEQVGERETPRVLDFGIATLAGDDAFSKLTQTGQLVGSPFYMAPERLFGGDVDASSDVYSLGVVLFRMLAGEHPYAGRNLDDLLAAHLRRDVRELEAPIPRAARDLVARAMSRDAPERPTATEFGDALASAAGSGSWLSLPRRRNKRSAASTEREAADAPTAMGNTGGGAGGGLLGRILGRRGKSGDDN